MGLFGRTMRPQNLRVTGFRDATGFGENVLAPGVRPGDIVLGGFTWDNAFPALANPQTLQPSGVAIVAPNTVTIGGNAPIGFGQAYTVWFVSKNEPEEAVARETGQDPNQYPRPYSSGFYPKGTWHTLVIEGGVPFTTLPCPGLRVGDVISSAVGYEYNGTGDIINVFSYLETATIVADDQIGFEPDTTGYRIRVVWASRDDRSSNKPAPPLGNGVETRFSGIPSGPQAMRFFYGIPPSGVGIPILMPDITQRSYILTASLQDTATGSFSAVEKDLELHPGGVITKADLGSGDGLYVVYLL